MQMTVKALPLADGETMSVLVCVCSLINVCYNIFRIASLAFSLTSRSYITVISK